ncbi:MAG: S8 family peptidase [Chloroflexi bacterium]|nr:S8 family peptidase [Chloroflexota bacterium]
MAGQRREPEQRINFLLPTQVFRGQLADRMTRSASPGEWSPEEYESAQIAASEMEARDVTYADTDPRVVTELLQALTAHNGMRTAMMAAGMDLTTPGNGYVALDQIQAVGPSAERPFVIPEIGVVSVPATSDAFEAAQAAVQRVQGGAIRVTPAVPMYAIQYNQFNQYSQAAEIGGIDTFDLPAEQFFDGEEPEEEWVEATLDAGTTGEILPWGVHRINAPRVWSRGYLGQGVRVAVVDTGVGPHIDLALPVAGATFVPGSISANDDNGHGTHMAGTILARRNGIGVVGVAPKASLLRAKVLDRTGRGTDIQVAAGIVWAANQGADIINLSLGGSFSPVVQRALAYARSRRVTLCAAAGNDFCRPVLYPARDPLCIAVAATDPTNGRTQFSNCGRELDLCAPGINILSTFLANSYRALNGTSVATTHVTGAAALLLSRAPGLNPARLQKHLERSALPLGPVNQFGRGLTQADRAVTLPILTTEGMPESLLVGADGGLPASQTRQPAAAGARRA